MWMETKALLRKFDSLHTTEIKTFGNKILFFYLLGLPIENLHKTLQAFRDGKGIFDSRTKAGFIVSTM
jgi:hypothetical protein